MFDSITNEANSKFRLAGRGGSLLAALLGLIAKPATGGFEGFVGRFRDAGLGELVESWITDGDNHPISDEQIESALGPDTIARLARQSGVDPATATSALGFMAPHLVDALTPNGEFPDEADLLALTKGDEIVVSPIGGTVRKAVGASEDESGGGILKWLIPLVLLALLVFIGISVCGKSEPLGAPAPKNNAKPANTSSPSANAAGASFRVVAGAGEFRV